MTLTWDKLTLIKDTLSFPKKDVYALALTILLLSGFLTKEKWELF